MNDEIYAFYKACRQFSDMQDISILTNNELDLWHANLKGVERFEDENGAYHARYRKECEDYILNKPVNCT